MNAFHRPVILILARIAKLAHRSRLLPNAGYTMADVMSNEDFEYTARQLELELEQLWEQRRPPVIDDLMTFESADEVFRTRWRRGVPTAQRVATIHRACVIYLWRVRTDRKALEVPYMIRERQWDRQGIDEQPERITQAVEDILTVTRDIIKTKMEKERRFMLFPLLCAGLECREVHEQNFILHVLEEMAYVTWGNNFPKTRALLQEIFKRQGGVRVSGNGNSRVEGRWRRVDWVGVLYEMGPFVFV
jgi:Fungal specific transcription factor domain